MQSGLQHAEAGRVAVALSEREGWRLRVSPLVAVLAAILLILIIPPTLFLVNTSFHTTRLDGSFDQFTLRYFHQLFTDPRVAATLLNTLVYAAGSSVIALALGVVQALIVERTNTPGRDYVFLGAVVSLAVPHVLYVVAWLLLLGRNGPVNGLIEVLGIDLASGWETFFGGK